LLLKKLAEEIPQSSPKIQLVNIPRPSSPQSPQSPHINKPLGGQTMAGATPPNPMDVIRASRYPPLVFPNNLHPLPGNDYMKYLPRFDNEGEKTTEENLTAYYSFADNFQVDYDDVWMRLFVKSLDGEVGKWFRNIRDNSISTITDLDATFLRKWGDKKDDLYDMTKFSNLRRKKGETVSKFSQIFNRMYQKIPNDIKPDERLANVTYVNSFDADFCFILREIRSTTLDDMQDSSLEVESTF
jgi:hypothetical protein